MISNTLRYKCGCGFMVFRNKRQFCTVGQLGAVLNQEGALMGGCFCVLIIIIVISIRAIANVLYRRFSSGGRVRYGRFHCKADSFDTLV